jgi:hypothetical protein
MAQRNRVLLTVEEQNWTIEQDLQGICNLLTNVVSFTIVRRLIMQILLQKSSPHTAISAAIAPTLFFNQYASHVQNKQCSGGWPNEHDMTVCLSGKCL